MTLTPTFNSDVTEYEATTSNNSNKVTAVATDPDSTILIENGETVVENGGNATWVDGENTLTITVTHGEGIKVYTVAVTKE